MMCFWGLEGLREVQCVVFLWMWVGCVLCVCLYCVLRGF